MNRGQVIVLLMPFISYVSAQSTLSAGTDSSYRANNLVSGFQPSLAIVTGVLSIMFTLTFVLLFYAKCCHGDQRSDGDGQIHPGIFGSNSSRFSGIDKTVIESLPFFRFSALKGSRQGLECAVCLSKFEDIEILRLLPKCKHAFHIGCIDQWLEQHSTCPLCRNRVVMDDLSDFAHTNSLRFLSQSSEISTEDLNLELYIEREEKEEEREGRDQGSSRFSVGDSFRKILKMGQKEKGILRQSGIGKNDRDHQRKILHRFNHKIIASDVVFKNRWSNVSSSDLMFLNSEMVNSITSERFPSIDEQKGLQNTSVPRNSEQERILQIKEEMVMKRMFENKLSSINKTRTNPVFDHENRESDSNLRNIEPGRRSVSEITAIPRLSVLQVTVKKTAGEMNNSGSAATAAASASSSSSSQMTTIEERRQRLWLPIARRTAQWFANREKRPQIDTATHQHDLDV